MSERTLSTAEWKCQFCGISSDVNPDMVVHRRQPVCCDAWECRARIIFQRDALAAKLARIGELPEKWTKRSGRIRINATRAAVAKWYADSAHFITLAHKHCADELAAAMGPTQEASHE